MSKFNDEELSTKKIRERLLLSFILPVIGRIPEIIIIIIIYAIFHFGLKII